MGSHCGFTSISLKTNDIEDYFMHMCLFVYLLWTNWMCLFSFGSLYVDKMIFFIILTVVVVEKVFVLFCFFNGFCKAFGYRLQNSREDLVRLCNNNKIILALYYLNMFSILRRMVRQIHYWLLRANIQALWLCSFTEKAISSRYVVCVRSPSKLLA